MINTIFNPLAVIKCINYQNYYLFLKCWVDTTPPIVESVGDGKNISEVMAFFTDFGIFYIFST